MKAIRPFLWDYCTDSTHTLAHTQVLANDIDLLHQPAELEKRKHKLKRLVQSPNSFFMDVKCQGCFNITTVFSHSQTVVMCSGCSAVLCQPTGGRARLTEGPLPLPCHVCNVCITIERLEGKAEVFGGDFRLIYEGEEEYSLPTTKLTWLPPLCVPFTFRHLVAVAVNANAQKAARFAARTSKCLSPYTLGRESFYFYSGTKTHPCFCII